MFYAGPKGKDVTRLSETWHLFTRFALYMSRTKINQMSDSGVALALGTLHLLSAQRVFNAQDMFTQAARIKQMSLNR